MKNKIVRIATIISSLLLSVALTFTAFADVSSGVESVVPQNFGTPKTYTLSKTTYTYKDYLLYCCFIISSMQFPKPLDNSQALISYTISSNNLLGPS